MSLSSDGAPMLTMPVAPANSGGSGGFGWGGDGAWWIIILFLFVFCGWGGNGWGNNAGNSGGVVVNTHGEAVSLVSYGSGSYTQTVPIDRALTVAGQLAK